MSRPYASAVCDTAVMYALRVPPVVYVKGGESKDKQDCQGHVEVCVRDNGGVMSYIGSNDMFRNACDWVGTIAEARALGYLVPGALLFQVKANPKPEDYPERYHGDGKGNAQHVGYWIGREDVQLTHASSSAGRVTTGTLHSSWNYVALAKAIDYSEYLGGGKVEEPEAPAVEEVSLIGVVATEKDNLNMRSAPGIGNAVVASLPKGAELIITQMRTVDGQLWGKTQWTVSGVLRRGWVSMAYVALRREEDVGTEVPEGPGYAGDGHIVTVSMPELDNIISLLAKLCADQEVSITQIQTIVASWAGYVG